MIRFAFPLVFLLITSTATCTELEEKSHSANKGARVALIIGNSDYEKAPLLNPANDASDLAYELKKKGFEVLVRENAGEQDLKDAVEEFAHHLSKGGGVGLFFFAGHGTQLEGENQLIPVDASFENAGDIVSKSVSAEHILNLMAKAGNRINIVILDACRNNPFDSKTQDKHGLAAMNMVNLPGTFISYATSPGATASDGSGHNGLFTQHLLSSLEEHGSGIEEVFRRVREGVAAESNKAQIPWTISSITDNFFFDRDEEERILQAGKKLNGTGGQDSSPGLFAVKPYDPAEEQLAWEKIKDSQNPDDYKKYLSHFAGSPNANFALFRFESLGGKIQNTEPVKTPPVITATLPPTLPPTIAPTPTPPHDVVSMIRDCPYCPELVVVPPGEFMMGKNPGDQDSEPDEAPQHRVRISLPLAVGKFEVTRGQYSVFIKDTGYRPQENGCNTKTGGRFHKDAKSNWHSPGFEQTETDPVVCVSWDDSMAYVDWLSKTTGKHYRLPSEAEWEYIAQSQAINFVKTEGEAPCRLFNIADASAHSVIPGTPHLACNDDYPTTAPSGSFPANSFGVFDMLGNVWEWVEDCWNGNYVGTPSDGSSWKRENCGERVFRGGGWSTSPKILHYAYRDRGDKVERYDDLGFRVLRTYP